MIIYLVFPIIKRSGNQTAHDHFIIIRGIFTSLIFIGDDVDDDGSDGSGIN